jgi:folate-binding protein YgfZ
MSRDVKDAVLARLDQLVFTEDVQLSDVTAAFTGIAVLGPRSASVAASVTGMPLDRLASLPEHGSARGTFAGGSVIAMRTTDGGEPGFDLLVDAAHAGAARDALRAAGSVEIGEEIAEVLRIEGGVPRFHRDMDEETIPLEAGIESRAISFTKGCYVGQEVIVRVLHRGHGRVARKLVGLALDGEAVPSAGAIVRADGREVGRVTSAAASRALGAPIALAYLQRELAATGTRVTVEGAAGVVTELPFVGRPA